MTKISQSGSVVLETMTLILLVILIGALAYEGIIDLNAFLKPMTDAAFDTITSLTSG